MVRTNPAGHFGAGLGGGEFVTTRSRHLSDWRLGQYCPNVSSSSSVLGEAFLLEFRHRNGWPTSFMPMPSFFNSAYMTCALVVPGGVGCRKGCARALHLHRGSEQLEYPVPIGTQVQYRQVLVHVCTLIPAYLEKNYRVPVVPDLTNPYFTEPARLHFEGAQKRPRPSRLGQLNAGPVQPRDPLTIRSSEF